ncbi:MAG: tetratricopeptide repeat protein [Planctomycetota bacterium]|nr:tetratricopeptide repeat protein [Planctomycetota bacterium]
MDPEERWDSLAAQADAYLRSRTSERLHEVAQELIECRPQDEFGYRMAGESWLQRGDLDKAIDHLRKAVEAEPEYDFALYRLGVMLRVDGKTKEAEQHVQQAIELDPEYAGYWVELGEIAITEDDHDGAERYANRALELDAEHVGARQLLSRSLEEAGPKKHAQRLEILDRALQDDPEDADVWDDRAALLLKMGRLDEAEDSARQALMLEPGNGYYRKTLYSVIKRRSWIYKFLRWPGDLVVKGFAWIDRSSWTFWILLCLIGVGSRIFLFLLALGAVWVTCFFPVLKLYEWMTISEIRKRAREIHDHTRRGGWFFRMPAWVRTLLFLAVAGGFWYGLYRLVDTEGGRRALVIGFGIVVGLAILLAIFGLFLIVRDKRRAKRRRKRTEGMLETS